MSDIVVVGSLNMDMVVNVPHIPAVGETLLATDIHHYAGGKGANQAVAAARLGAKVSMIGRVGKDKNGELLLKNLRDNNIDVSGMEIDEDMSGTAFINVDPLGDNNIVVYPGANNKITIDQIERHRSIIENSKICILQLEIPYNVVKYVVDLCYEKGVKVIFNPAPALEGIEDELIKKTYILVPNETELAMMSGKIEFIMDNIEDLSRKVYSRGCENLIVTLGNKGSLYVKDGCLKYFESKKVKAVDTTAAGDSFVGGLAVGLVEGKSIEESIKFATFVSALAVTKNGAQDSLPNRLEVEEFIDIYKPL